MATKKYSQLEIKNIYDLVIEKLNEGLKAKNTKERSAALEAVDEILKFYGYKDLSELIGEMSDKEEEKLLVLNEDGSSSGEMIERGQVHSKGLWHREVGWLPVNYYIDNDGKKKLLVMLEMRSYTKKQHPGSIALVAGHVTGEMSSHEAVCEEASEELKRHYQREEFMQITKPSKNVREGENNCYATAYVVFEPNPNSMTFQSEEVRGIAWYTIDDFEEMIKSHDTKKYIFRDNEYYNNIIASLREIEKCPSWDAFLIKRDHTLLQSLIGLSATAAHEDNRESES